MASVHNRGSWIVYLNGIEVPAISANVSSGVWTVPQASVQFPADRILQRVGVNDRVRMTIFALDPYRGRVERNEPKFRLAFDGEIVAYSYQSSSTSRAITFTGVDMMESLMRIFPFFISSLNSLVKGQTSVDQAKLTSVGNPFAITHSLFTSGVTGQGRIKRPFDFVQNILDYLLGDVLDQNDKSMVIQQWFAPWDARTNFSKRFVPSAFIESINAPEDNPVFPIFKAAQKAKAVEALADMGDSLGNGGSMWQLVQSVFQHVYYELAMIPNPPLLRVNEETNEVDGGANDAAGAGSEFRVAHYMTKPQTLFSVPPTCNVVWPSMVEQISYDENYATQPTRTYIGNPHLFNYVANRNTDAGLAAVAQRALTVGFPAIANERLRTKENGDKINQHNFITPEEQFKGPVYNQLATPTWFSYLQQRDDGASTDPELSERSASLQALYAKYEHFRVRASRRNGGVVGSYNPYAVAGFSGMVIDNEHSGNHIMAYFTRVSHSFTQNSMTTTIGFSHAQTISEYFDTLVDRLVRDEETDVDLTTFNRGAPEQPIWELRNQFQSLQEASNYYAAMLWGDILNDAPPQRSAFDIFDVFGIANDKGEIEDIDINADLAIAKGSDKSPTGPRLKLKTTSSPLTGEPPDFRVKGAYRRLLDNPAAAFAASSRPITTLEQWIDAQGARGGREGRRLPANKDEGKGAPYYVRILFGDPGPPFPPPKVDLDGNPCNTLEVDTTRDWAARLRAYRRRVYKSRAPFRA